MMSSSFKNKLLMLSLLLGLGFSSMLPSTTPNPEFRVSILQLVEHPALDATERGITDELKEAFKGKNLHIDYQSAQGNSALAAQIAQKYASNSPNVMVGIATISAQALVAADKRQLIPVVFSSVTDPKAAQLVQNLEKPEGVVTGVSNYVDPGLQFDLFKKILPNLKKIGIIYNPGEANSVALNAEMEKIAKIKNIELVFAPANTSADVSQATNNLMNKVQAIFVNNDNTALSAFDSIVKIATKHQVPVFCSDTDMIERGALAVLGPNQYEVGRQTGKMIVKIMQGEKISQIPVGFPEKTEIKLNAEQAKKLKIEIPKNLLNLENN